MLSPLQRWLQNPTNSRWEQPTFASLKTLRTDSAPLRKKQAVQLWQQNVLELAKEVSPLQWALLYSTIAPVLKSDATSKKLLKERNNPNDQWLNIISVPLTTRNNQKMMPLILDVLKNLGHESVLSKVLVQSKWPAAKQIEAWRSIYPQDPMHEKMHYALEIQAVRNNTLDGYLKARKRFQSLETSETVTLTCLDDTTFTI